MPNLLFSGIHFIVFIVFHFSYLLISIWSMCSPQLEYTMLGLNGAKIQPWSRQVSVGANFAHQLGIGQLQIEIQSRIQD